ncbi:DUF2157 domain-containing protein [Flammeovirga sp. SJP92]|uniref:DUF2157 domain-containing protein n=1 Tax=Flammeovirga sp. SJP92 TaxID=1775430 RepID=UPI0007873075|nr:DUF2157 domain-containing protein [Flammeovirga sp. SJP92]KXX70584.1 hypothetical protein AVL50_08250 [Flammeovirga sp. SJP92]
MTKLTRNDIQLINKYADFEENEIDTTLKENVLINKEEWNNTLRIIMLTLGLGFFAIGLMFFYAYNWDDLSKTGKLLSAELVVICSVALFIFYRNNTIYSKIIATAISFLIGVMFAVFGQVYQTGANAYDFFLGWSFSIALIVFLTDFAVLWFLYLLLVSTTWHFYILQAVGRNAEALELLVIFLLYVVVFVFTHYLQNIGKQIPVWWKHSIVMIAVSVGTILGIEYIIEFKIGHLPSGMIITPISVVYALGLYYSLQEKYIVPFALILFSCIILLTTVMVNEADDFITATLLVSLFVLMSMTGLIYKVVSLQKKWNNE